MHGNRNAKVASLSLADCEELQEKYGSLNKAADKIGVGRETLKHHVRDLRRENPFGAKQAPKPKAIAAPRKGVKRFIFSCAQNETEVHEGFMDNLEAYAKHLDAEIHISGFTYGKRLFEDHSAGRAAYHPRVETYLTRHKFDIGGKLLFCGEMNILPTAERPLQGFEAYTRGQWAIIPHVKVQLESVPTNASTPPKIIMTTGTVTKRNYVQKKAGIKAEFHHVIGAVLVEIDNDGDFFCRHLLGDHDGNFQDLDTKVANGKVTDGHRVQCITWGDIHTEMLDPDVAFASWGLDVEEETEDDKTVTVIQPAQRTNGGSMLDTLQPKFQVFHDVLDFRRRNHHNAGDPHFLYEAHVRGRENVEHEVMAVSCFLHATRRDYCTSIIVDSNHDRALKRWLREADYRKDPINARFFLECQLEIYKAIDERRDFHLAAWAISQYLDHSDKFRFLKNTDTFQIDGIEKALHGDQGANGAKGSLYSFARMGPKATVAHDHGAGIFEGIVRVGTSSKLDCGYNRGGLSSWNHTHEVQYANGKRTLITIRHGKWRA